ncbi:hypothetical protein GCM10029992_11060 [Glycomyces albus]
MRQAPVELAEVVDLAADDVLGERLDRRAADVVAASDGEGEAVAFAAVVGVQDDVGRRVVGVGVHRVGAVEAARSGEADVHYVHGGNSQRLLLFGERRHEVAPAGGATGAGAWTSGFRV